MVRACSSCVACEHWAQRMGVDGFRFDLASVFARNEDGSINTDSPAIAIELTAAAVVFDLRLIAEAWDVDAYLARTEFPGTRVATMERAIPR